MTAAGPVRGRQLTYNRLRFACSRRGKTRPGRRWLAAPAAEDYKMAPTVGIPRVLTYYKYQALWRTFFDLKAK